MLPRLDPEMIPTSAIPTASAASAPAAPARGHLSGLDGLRGTFAMMVVFFHLNLLGVGWAGVACFFVLSGFLITRILFGDIESSGSLGQTLKRFYIRRTLRVLPLYYLCLIVLLIAGRFVAVVHQQTAAELPYAFAYVYDVFMMTSAHHGTHLMDHLWSLSVEEQFYLVWPLVVYFAGRRGLPWVALAIIFAAPLIRWLTVAYWPPPLPLHFVDLPHAYFAAYFSPLSSLDGFAVGALLTCVRVRPRVWWMVAALAISYLIAVPVQGWGIGAFWQYGPPLTLGYPISLPAGLQYVWGYSVIYLDCALLILLVCQPNALQRFFSRAPLEWLGKRSYAIYIIHYPLLFTTEPLLHRIQGAIGIGYDAMFCFVVLYVTLLLAVAHLVHERFEKPILKLKDRFAAVPSAAPGARPQFEVAG